MSTSLSRSLRLHLATPVLSYTVASLRKMSTKRLSSLPISVKVSPQEVSAKRLTWQNLELATRAIHRDGLVILEDVIDRSKLDSLNHEMVEDALRLQAAGDASPYNYNKGNIQQDPPATKQYFEPSIFLNPIATQVTSSILGPRPRLSFLSGNTALPTESRFPSPIPAYPFRRRHRPPEMPLCTRRQRRPC